MAALQPSYRDFVRALRAAFAFGPRVVVAVFALPFAGATFFFAGAAARFAFFTMAEARFAVFAGTEARLVYFG